MGNASSQQEIPSQLRDHIVILDNDAELGRELGRGAYGVVETVRYVSVYSNSCIDRIKLNNKTISVARSGITVTKPS